MVKKLEAGSLGLNLGRLIEQNLILIQALSNATAMLKKIPINCQCGCPIRQALPSEI